MSKGFRQRKFLIHFPRRQHKRASYPNDPTEPNNAPANPKHPVNNYTRWINDIWFRTNRESQFRQLSLLFFAVAFHHSCSRRGTRRRLSSLGEENQVQLLLSKTSWQFTQFATTYTCEFQQGTWNRRPDFMLSPHLNILAVRLFL